MIIVAAVLLALGGLLIIPIRLHILLTFFSLWLPSGGVTVKVGCFQIAVRGEIKRCKQRLVLCWHIGRAGKMHNASLHIPLPSSKDKRKPKINSLLWRHAAKLLLRHSDVTVHIGTGDAALTALLCAALIQTFQSFRRFLTCHFFPRYDCDCFSLEMQCIAHLTLGKLWISAVQYGLSILKRNNAGGAKNGTAETVD